MSRLVLPDVNKVRSCIESVQREDMRNYLKALYLLGAARAYEMTGRNYLSDSGHAKIVYGPKGTDATETTYQPTELSVTQAAMIFSGNLDAKTAFNPEPIALFRIKIAKRHLQPNEQAHSRLVALPLNPEYEPWTKDLYAYFKQAGPHYVFPFTRQAAWFWITHKEPVFKDLSYPIQTYRIRDKNKLEKTTIPMHQRDFKLHALRHLRINELVEYYDFEGLDYIAYIGWSMSTSTSQAGSQIMPAMFKVYGTDIYEKWRRYIRKLLKKRTW